MLVRRTIVIGTVEKYPTVELANAAINGFRLQLNSKRSRLTVSQPLVTISDLIDHYIQVELSSTRELAIACNSKDIQILSRKMDPTTMGNGTNHWYPYRVH
jgi:hypothetical protein